MGFVVTSPCIGTKDGACAKVCPVQCFYDAGEMLMIKKDECICCSLCVPECPVEAIFDEEELSTEQHVFLTQAQTFFGGKTPAELQALQVSP